MLSPTKWLVCLIIALVVTAKGVADEATSQVTSDGVIDASTFDDKVLCGYQGWFRCSGDGSKLGWVHWSRGAKEIKPDSLTFEMWPDMSELDDDEKYPTPGFRYPDGEQAHLFSSVHPKTVHRHFEWMRDYGIHGAWLQRFVVDLKGGPAEQRYESNLKVIDNVRKSAQETGRVWTIAYDMSSMPIDMLFEVMTGDWKHLVDSGVTRDPRFLHHNGKPVLMVWGFFADRMKPQLAKRIVDFFKKDPKYGVFLVGGCQWHWREMKDPAWSSIFRSFDAISPWNVGNVSLAEDKTKWATTSYWNDDLAEALKAGMLYMPVLWPGFSWDNLKRLNPGTSNIPRLRGGFYWKQFAKVRELKLRTAYVAMFDEVDEATAIFKVTNQPPLPGHFVDLEELPSDWYLRLTGAGTKMLLGEAPHSNAIPIDP